MHIVLVSSSKLSTGAYVKEMVYGKVADVILISVSAYGTTSDLSTCQTQSSFLGDPVFVGALRFPHYGTAALFLKLEVNEFGDFVKAHECYEKRLDKTVLPNAPLKAKVDHIYSSIVLKELGVKVTTWPNYISGAPYICTEDSCGAGYVLTQAMLNACPSYDAALINSGRSDNRQADRQTKHRLGKRPRVFLV